MVKLDARKAIEKRMDDHQSIKLARIWPVVLSVTLSRVCLRNWYQCLVTKYLVPKNLTQVRGISEVSFHGLGQ